MKGFILWTLTIATMWIAIEAFTMHPAAPGVGAIFGAVSLLLLWAAPGPGGNGKAKKAKGGGNPLASLISDRH